MSVIRLIGAAGTTGWCAYIWASFLIGILRDLKRDAPAALRAVRSELRPFALPLALGSYLPNLVNGMSFWNYIGLAIALACWALYRHDQDDDDRWKRRGKKVAEKVAQVGGKLVLVPAASPP